MECAQALLCFNVCGRGGQGGPTSKEVKEEDKITQIHKFYFLLAAALVSSANIWYHTYRSMTKFSTE